MVEIVFIERDQTDTLRNAVAIGLKADGTRVDKADSVYCPSKIIDMVVSENSAEDIALLNPACELSIIDIGRAGALAENSSRISGILDLPEAVGINIVPFDAALSRQQNGLQKVVLAGSLIFQKRLE